MAGSELTPRQERFIAEYLRDYNATKAAIRAGYAIKSAARSGHRNTINDQIAGIIRAHLDEQMTQAVAESGEVISQTVAIAKSDIRRVMWCRTQADFDALPDHVAAAIQSVEILDSPDGGLRIKVRMNPKAPALEQLFKHLGLYAPERREVSHPDEPVGEVFVFLDPSHKP